MKEKEYKRKLKRLEWLCDNAERIDTTVWDDEIETLANEVEMYENKEFPIPPPNPIELIKYHIERLNIQQNQMAEALGITKSHLTNLFKGKKRVTEKFSNYIYDFDFNSLNKLK